MTIGKPAHLMGYEAPKKVQSRSFMRQYELTYLISDDVAESEINKVSGRINGYVTDGKGKVLKEESWGRRKLAYPIKKQQFATYITLNFELEPENLREIEKDIFHAPEILRHLMLVRDFGKEELTLTAEDIAETGEIEEVVGGEKSFEAIEGETEESRDLMAVRGDEEESDEKIEMRDEEKEDEKLEIKSEEETEEAEDKKEKSPETPVEEIEKPVVEESDFAEATPDKKEKAKTVRKPRVKKITEKVEKVEPEKQEEPETKEEPEKKMEKKTAVKQKVKTKAIKNDNVGDEADRLAKLDKELDDILGDEL